MQRRPEFTAPAIDLARNGIGKFAAPASVRVQNAMRVACCKSVLHIVSEVYGSKPRGVSAFEVLGAIFSAGALAVAQSPHAVQLLRLRPRRMRES